MKHMKSARGEGHAPAKMLKSIEVTKGAEGGHVMMHHFVNSGAGPYNESEPHPFGPGQDQEAMSHMAEHMGMNTEPSEHEGEEEGQEEEA
jgi:hypothetical protein